MSRREGHAGLGRPSHRDDVVWAWGLIAVTVPAGIAALLLGEVVAELLGWTAGASRTGEQPGRPVLDVSLYLAMAAPLVGSVVLGVRAWRLQHASLGLRAAVVSSGLLVVGTALVLLSA